MDFSKIQFHPQWQQMLAPPPQQPQQAPVKQRGKGGFLSSIISELSGGIGAAGGAAIGTALLPGIGTLAGAGIGGLLGGFGGRVAENKVRDNRYGVGDALKEGALSGALSLGGEAFQLAKAGKAVTGSSKLLHPIENIVAGGQARAAGASVGAIEGLGKGLKAGGMNLAQGATAPGVEGLGAKASDNLVKTLTKDFGIKVGSPESVQRALEPKLASLGEKLTARYAKSNVAILPEEINKLGTNILERATTQGGLDKAGEKYALEQAQRLVKTKDIAGLWQFTKDLESTSSKLARGTTGATSSKNAVIDIIRGEIRPFLQDKVPGVAADNALYHSGLDANKLLIKGSKNMAGGGLVGKITNLAPVKGAEAKLGQGIETVGKITGNPITQNLIRQSPASLSRALGGMAQAPSSPDMNQADPSQIQDYSQASFGDPTQVPQGWDTQTYANFQQANPGLSVTPEDTQQMLGAGQSQQPTYTLQNALQDSRRDPKNASQYLAYAKAFSDQAATDAKASGDGPNITKVTGQQYQLATRGNQAVDQLEQLLRSDPNVLSKSATPGRKLPVVGGFISNAAGTGNFDAIGYNVASSLLRIETGAQANPQEIKNLQTQMMPRAGDSQQTIQTKLAQLRQAFAGILNTANGNFDYSGNQANQSIGGLAGALQ